MVNCLLLCLFAPNFLGLMCCWLQYAAKVGQGQFKKVGVEFCVSNKLTLVS